MKPFLKIAKERDAQVALGEKIIKDAETACKVEVGTYLKTLIGEKVRLNFPKFMGSRYSTTVLVKEVKDEYFHDGYSWLPDGICTINGVVVPADTEIEIIE